MQRERKRPAAHAQVAVAALAMLVAAPLNAQWVDYWTPGIPRTSNGSPKLDAPAPRTSDGKPDLSGVWGWEHNRPCPPDGCPDQQVGQEFVNLAWSLKGALPYQPWALELVKKRKADNAKDDPKSFCLPEGAVRVHTDGLLKKIIQTPGLLVILHERDAAYRQIFTDGRPLPADPNPSWNGYSSGKWEGDTLVVQTIGFRDDLWLDTDGNPLTSAAKVTEKFRRPSFGTLEIEITIDDPKAYTTPWTVKLKQPIVLDNELLDYICLENEKDSIHFVGHGK